MPPSEASRQRITFVTGNAGKVREMQAALGDAYQIVADDRGYPEIQADTLEEVARSGAASLLEAGLEPPFLLEDAGLAVTALRGFPGVYSRYAFDTLGCNGILRLLRDVEAESRTAAFEAQIAYVDVAREVHLFTGTARGRIAEAARGEQGFGFDPIFVPDAGDGRTFAQMDAAEKGALSHRGAAADAFRTWLSNQ